jgi:glycerol transport system ATP-binding protein
VREDVAAILFDEPLTVIDPHRKWLLRRKLKEIHKQFRHTLIYVTHDQTEALTFADEVVVMQQGEVLQRGTPEDLFRRPAHTYVGYFIGSPGMNILPCEVDHPAPPFGGTRARIGEHHLALPDATWPSGSLELGIRPEHIIVLGDGNPDAGLPVTVRAVEDHGRFRIVTAQLDHHRLKIRIPQGGTTATATATAIAPGAILRVEFPADHLCLYRDSRLVSPEPRVAVESDS